MKIKFLILFLSIQNLISQDFKYDASYSSADEKCFMCGTRNNIFSFGVLGTSSYVGFNYEYFVSDQLAFEAGIGLVGYGIGTSFFLKKINKYKTYPYIGLKFAGFRLFRIGPNDEVLYIPLGLRNINARTKMNVSVDIGPAFKKFHNVYYDDNTLLKENYKPYNVFGVWGSIKIGFPIKELF